MIACAELKTFGNFLKFSSGPLFSATCRVKNVVRIVHEWHVKRIDFIAATCLVKNVRVLHDLAGGKKSIETLQWI